MASWNHLESKSLFCGCPQIVRESPRKLPATASVGWRQRSLHEKGWNYKVIERQLAHAERNAVSAAHNFAEHLPARRKMTQAWAE
jgi:hypothetical protein